MSKLYKIISTMLCVTLFITNVMPNAFALRPKSTKATNSFTGDSEDKQSVELDIMREQQKREQLLARRLRGLVGAGEYVDLTAVLASLKSIDEKDEESVNHNLFLIRRHIEVLQEIYIDCNMPDGYVSHLLKDYSEPGEEESLEHIMYVISTIRNEQVVDEIVKLLESHADAAVRESAAIILSYWCSPTIALAIRLKAYNVLAKTLGPTRTRIFDTYDIWIIDIRVEEEYKFRDSDIEGIERSLQAVPRAHLDVCRVIIKTYPEEYQESVPEWIRADEEDLVKRISLLGTYGNRLFIVRINSPEGIGETVAHEIGHGVYDFCATDKHRARFDALHKQSRKSTNYSDFAYFYGATNEQEDFATIYEVWQSDRKELQRRKQDSDLLLGKVSIIEEIETAAARTGKEVDFDKAYGIWLSGRKELERKEAEDAEDDMLWGPTAGTQNHREVVGHEELPVNPRIRATTSRLDDVSVLFASIDTAA
ncbi:hypothetical protein ACFL0T_01865 [Candidatus Omnitrophota bacterium]